MSDLAKDLLQSVARQTHDLYVERNTILSFDEYLDEVAKSPKSHLRNAATYFSPSVTNARSPTTSSASSSSLCR